MLLEMFQVKIFRAATEHRILIFTIGCIRHHILGVSIMVLLIFCQNTGSLEVSAVNKQGEGGVEISGVRTIKPGGGLYVSE